MILYKKQGRVGNCIPGGQGFQDDISYLTDWLSEDKFNDMLSYYKNLSKNESWCGYIVHEIRFVPCTIEVD